MTVAQIEKSFSVGHLSLCFSAPLLVLLVLAVLQDGNV